MTIVPTLTDRGGGLPTPTEMRPSTGGVPGWVGGWVGWWGVCPEGHLLKKMVPRHPPRDIHVHLPGPGYREVWRVGLD